MQYAACVVSLFLRLNVVPFARAQTPPTPQDPRMQRCMQEFNPNVHIPILARKITSAGATAQETLIEYAQCSAMADRSAHPCDILHFIPGNAVATCRQNFSGLIFWRDLAAGYSENRLDSRDLNFCGKLSMERFGSPAKARQVCHVFVQAHASGTSICRPNAWNAAGLSFGSTDHDQCEQYIGSYSNRQSKSATLDHIQAAMMNRLFNKNGPACGAYPFDESFGLGTCRGAFEKKGCDQTLLRLRDFYCRMPVDKPARRRGGGVKRQ